MNGRSIAVGLATAVCTFCVSTFILLATLQGTLYNRAEVKSWLRDSNTYATVSQNAAETSAKQATTNSLIGQQTVQTAVAQTFTPDYLQTKTEGVLDGLYDWMEDGSSTPNLLLSVADKQPELTSNLTSQLAPTIAALPACGSPSDFNAQALNCLPAGTDVNQIANQVATQTVGSAEATADPLAQGDAATAIPPPAPLAGIIAKNKLGMWLTSSGAIIAIAIVALIAATRLRALMRLSARVAFGAIFALVLGLLLVYFGPAVSLGYVSGDQQALLQKVLEPLIKTAAPDIGRRLALIAGIVVAISGGAWVVMMFVRQRLNESSTLHPDIQHGLPPAGQGTPN